MEQNAEGIDKDIIRTVKRKPGIVQKDIVAKLEHRSNKNTIIRHVKNLVREGVIQEEKSGKRVAYVCQGYDNYEELKKGICYQIDKLCEDLQKTKEMFTSCEYDVQTRLLRRLEDLPNFEKYVQTEQEQYVAGESIESELSQLVDAYHEIINIDIKNAKMPSDTKQKLCDIVRSMSKKLQKYYKEDHDWKEKSRNTKNKKIQQDAISKCRKIDDKICDVEHDLYTKIQENLRVEFKEIPKVVEEMYEKYIDEKPSVYSQINELIYKKCPSRLQDAVLNQCQVIENDIRHDKEKYIDLINRQKNNNKEDYVDSINYEIEILEKKITERKKDQKRLLQDLKSGKSLSDIVNR